MRTYHLTLNCSQEEAKRRLKLQMSPNVLGGYVDDTQFKINRRLSRIFSNRGVVKNMYCFYGAYQQSGKQTQLVYQVRSGASMYVVYSLLGFLALGMLAKFFFVGEGIYGFIASLIFGLIYFGIVQIEKKLCISNFEAELTTETSRKNRRHL